MGPPRKGRSMVEGKAPVTAEITSGPIYPQTVGIDLWIRCA